MRYLKSPVWLCFAALTLLSSSITAAPVSSCAADFSSCNVYEGQILQLPINVAFGIAGDVVVKDFSGLTVDVFRIFNDLVDTGGGTGLGSYAFLYGADLGNLPNPSTYSANAVTISRSGTGPSGYYETDYNGNGTIYRLFTPAPEPSVFTLLGLGVFALGGLLRKHSRP